MTWRRIPPVSSPVSLPSLVAGAAAAGVGMESPAPVETALRQTFGARTVVLTDSGTSALVIALRIAAGAGTTVAMPAYVCIDLIAAAQRANVRVRLYDVDPNTLSPDLGSLRSAIARGARAVVVAPLYGYPADVPAVRTIAAEAGARVIEDAAQSAGATLGGRRIGTFGDVSVLSFGRGKGTTGGSGGALIVHDEALMQEADAAARSLGEGSRGVRDVVALAAQWLLGRPSVYALPASIPSLKLGEMVYHAAGEPCRLSAAATRIVRTALAADAAEVLTRRAFARLLSAAADQGGRLEPIVPVQDGEPGFLRLAARGLSGGTTAPALGVLRGYPVTLDEHPETRTVLAPGETAGSGARSLRDTLVTIPTHSRMSGSDLRRLERWLASPERGTSS